MIASTAGVSERSGQQAGKCLPTDWMSLSPWRLDVLHSLTRGTGDFCDSVLHFCWLEQREGSPHYCTILFAKSGPVKPFLWSLISWGVVEWGNMAGKRSCPWALTVLISKHTFKVVDNLSGSMMRCRVNQNLFDFFTGKVISMHVGLVFLFLALGFIQLLIFFFLVVTTLMLIQVKIFVIFPRQPHNSLRMWWAPVCW